MARYQERYFGNCPVCGQTDGYLNISCNHWFVCHEHKSKWFVGSNLFSIWRFENESNWLGNAALLNRYQDVEPMGKKQNTAVSTGKEKEVRNLEELRRHLGDAFTSIDLPSLAEAAENASENTD